MAQAALKHMIDQCTGMCTEVSGTQILGQILRMNQQFKCLGGYQICFRWLGRVHCRLCGRLRRGVERLLVSIAYRRDPAKPSSSSKAIQLCIAIDSKFNPHWKSNEVAAACASVRLDLRGRITKSNRAVRTTSRWNKSGNNCEVEDVHEAGRLICRRNKQGAGVG